MSGPAIYKTTTSSGKQFWLKVLAILLTIDEDIDSPSPPPWRLGLQPALSLVLDGLPWLASYLGGLQWTLVYFTYLFKE